jgi:murein DD-endopeptidase MepM/ murein hydrolase activator NlpD
MHTLNRLFVLLLIAVVLVPTGTGSLALLSMQDKQEANASLHVALDKAVKSYRNRAGLQSLKDKSLKMSEEQRKRIEQLDVRSRKLRAEIVTVRATLTKLQKRYHTKLDSAEAVHKLMEEEKVSLANAVRAAYAIRLSRADATDVRRLVVHKAAGDVPVGEAANLSLAAITQAHLQYLSDLKRAKQVHERIAVLQKEREQVLSERLSSAQKMEAAVETAELTAEQMEEIKAIMEDVHDQVLKLQRELARIDARLRAKAERVLIEKGLLDPLAPRDGTMSAKRPNFSWPVYGPISAGFKNAAYQKHFGVEHYAIDIVVGEGTPVSSTADGVVFLVRDGGAKGYTYVLIGHRNGYASLYGHLLAVSVTAGQEVTAGQQIGLSGGRPGTPGAGPMTTNPHLHFEVIQSGVNIDPKTVLP